MAWQSAEHDADAFRLNAATTLGRIGLVAPAALAEHIAPLARQWFYYLTWLQDDYEKEHAYQGLTQTVMANIEICKARVAVGLGFVF